MTKAGESVIETDVLVIGASASGVCAAVQAGRMGARVLLAEPTEWVGGMLTAAGVSAIDGNHELPSGLWGEFRRALREHYGGAEALATGWVSNTLYDPRVGLRILERWIAETPAIRLERGWYLDGVLRDDDRIRGARFGSGREVRTVRASVTVFADEYGDAVAAAGLDWRIGLESRKETGEPEAPARPLPHPQDFTWAATVHAPPSGFASAADAEAPAGTPDAGEFAGILDAARGSWDRFFDYGRLPDDLVMLNWPTQDCYGDYLDPGRRAAVLEAGRQKTIRLVGMLQAVFGTSVVATADLYPTGYTALIPYIREARRILSVETLTTIDLVRPAKSKALRTSVAVGDYPLDHHRRHDPDAPRLELPPIAAFGVPYGALLPRGVGGVLVVEKSIGVSGLVNGCTRLQPVVIQIGQAAGAAAALAARSGAEPSSVSAAEVQRVLLEVGGYLVPSCDVDPTAGEFAALQWAASAGYIPMRYVSEGWANKAYLDPDEPMSHDDLSAAGRLHAIHGFFDGEEESGRSLGRAIRSAQDGHGRGERLSRREFASRIYAAGGGG